MGKVVLHLPMSLVGVLDTSGSFKGERTAKLWFHHMLGDSYGEERPPWSVVSHLGSHHSALWGIHASKLYNIVLVFSTVSPCKLQASYSGRWGKNKDYNIQDL